LFLKIEIEINISGEAPPSALDLIMATFANNQ
jgi:hypothetical protein